MNSTKDKLENETPHFGNTLLGAVPSVVYNEDCVEGLKRFNDNHFDLAIVDPPYGIMDRMYNGGDRNASTVKFKKHIKDKRWDIAIPKEEYFDQLFRVSKNQIIFGGNYFPLPPSRCVIAWDKMVYVPTMSQIEIAWTSFDSPARLVKINNNDNNRFHPTQKPIKLYDWALNQYAKKGDFVLDTHLGSGSSRIAAYKGDFNFTGFEIDKDYYEAQEKRFKDFVSQLRMF